MKKNFTLAEVLITLGIIGIVAALTIPSIFQKVNEKIAVKKLQKTYAILSEAVRLAINEYGDVDGWDLATVDSAAGGANLYNNITPFLKTVKACNTTRTRTCFAPVNNYKALDGKTTGSFIQPGTFGTGSQGQLANGVSFTFWSPGNEAKKKKKNLGTIIVDLNGQEGPNRAGVDLFLFYIIYQHGLFPATPKLSSNSQKCIYNNMTSANGCGCAGWVIKKGNMDYLRRDISSEYNW